MERAHRALWLPAIAVVLPCVFIAALGVQWVALEREAAGRRSAEAARDAIAAGRRKLLDHIQQMASTTARELAAGRAAGADVSGAVVFDASGRTLAPSAVAAPAADRRAEALLATARAALQSGGSAAAERATSEIFECCAALRDELGVAYAWYAAWQRAALYAAEPRGAAKSRALTRELIALTAKPGFGTADDVAQAAAFTSRVGANDDTAELLDRLDRARADLDRREAIQQGAWRWASRLDLQDGRAATGELKDGDRRQLAAALRLSDGTVIVLWPDVSALAAWTRASQPGGAFDLSLDDAPSLTLSARPISRDAATDRGRQRLFVGAIAGALLLTLLVGYLATRDRLRERRTAAVRSAFVTGVTHDLKTPLASIRLLAETLRRDRVLPEARDELLETIVEESDRLGGLIDNVLAASKIESGTQIYSARLVAVAPLVQSAIRRFEPILRASAFELETRIDDENLCVHVDPTALEHCVLNLLSNAVKYSGSSRAIRVTALRSDTQVEISVSDQGIGVPPGEQAKIFERFYRTREAAEATTGVGLGLSLVRHFADAHSGRVTLHSWPGEGSVFTIWLPVAPRHG